MAIWYQTGEQFLTLSGCDAPPEVAVPQESIIAAEQLGRDSAWSLIHLPLGLRGSANTSQAWEFCSISLSMRGPTTSLVTREGEM